MDIDKVLVFDMWGDYAHFRRGYTTTSPLTYPFPSRTTLSGIISAILGYERDTYYDYFNENNSLFAIQILAPIKKTIINMNLIDTKIGFYLWDCKGQRTQIPYEFIKGPSYRFYISLDNQEIFDKLFTSISNHNSVYTPYLGISECISNFKGVQDVVYPIEKKEANCDPIDVHTIIPKDKAKLIIENNKVYGTVKLPGFFERGRTVTKYLEFYYEENGMPIKIANGTYYHVVGKDDNIILF